MKNKYVYDIDMNNEKVAKISISKSLSTKEIEGMLTMILSCIKTARCENDIDTPNDIDVPETCKEWR